MSECAAACRAIDVAQIAAAARSAALAMGSLALAFAELQAELARVIGAWVNELIETLTGVDMADEATVPDTWTFLDGTTINMTGTWDHADWHYPPTPAPPRDDLSVLRTALATLQGGTVDGWCPDGFDAPEVKSAAETRSAAPEIAGAFRGTVVYWVGQSVTVIFRLVGGARCNCTAQVTYVTLSNLTCYRSTGPIRVTLPDGTVTVFGAPASVATGRDNPPPGPNPLRTIRVWNGHAWAQVRMQALRTGDLFTISTLPSDADPGRYAGIFRADCDGRLKTPADSEPGEPYLPDVGMLEYYTSGQRDPSRVPGVPDPAPIPGIPYPSTPADLAKLVASMWNAPIVALDGVHPSVTDWDLLGSAATPEQAPAPRPADPLQPLRDALDRQAGNPLITVPADQPEVRGGYGITFTPTILLDGPNGASVRASFRSQRHFGADDVLRVVLPLRQGGAITFAAVLLHLSHDAAGCDVAYESRGDVTVTDADGAGFILH